MQKKTFFINSKDSLQAHNALIQLDKQEIPGKGYKFKSRFITPGIAGYPEQFGNVLIQKESFDKFINSIVGVPVIIRHKDFAHLVSEEVNELRIGTVSSVWFNDDDGWYWCEGIIWDETAINLITDKGWSVSCSYDVVEADDTPGTWNNTPYEMEFLDGAFTHLALVDNPRYERANIIFNSKTIVNKILENTKNIEETEDMSIIDEIQNFIDKYKANNSKGDAMKKAQNESVDKREILREAEAIAMKPAADFDGGEEEKFKTLAKKLEELSYEKSEDSTSDNEKEDSEDKEDKEKSESIENESEKDQKEYEEFKKDIDKEAKADNSKSDYFDGLRKIYNSTLTPQEQITYIPRSERLERGKKY